MGSITQARYQRPPPFLPAEQAALCEPRTAGCEGRNNFSTSLSKRGKIERLCPERGY
jgi:hypothetical protein